MEHFTKCLKFLLLALCIVGGVGSAWADDKTSTLTFTAACGGSGTANDGAVWTVTSDGTESSFDSTKGIHYGTGSAQVTYIQLATSDISGTISKIVVNASTASGVTATVGVTVGGDAFGGDAKSLSSSAADYTFEGSASGEIVVTVTKPSKAAKAIYVKSIVVTYTTSGGDTPTAKNLSSIELSGEYPTVFTEGDAFSYEGMTVTAFYDDETDANVTAKATFTGYNMSTLDEQQTVTVSYTENEVTKTAEYTIIVNAIPTHTVTWSVNGATTTADYKEGAAIEFPSNPAAIEGKSFVGWFASTITGEIDEEPEFVTSATMGNDDITYYAVFASVTPGIQTKIIDNLTNSAIGITGTTYKDWSELTLNSDAVYDGNSAGGNTSVQLRSTSPSGIVSKTTGGKVTKVEVSWNSNTAAGRTLDIYGKSTAYDSAADLYDDDTKGTKIGSISKGSTTCNLSGIYEYIGFRSNSGAMYLNSISITWTSGTPDTYSAYCTTVAADTRAEAGISFAEEAVTKEIVAEYTGQDLTNPNSLAITWTSSNESVATVEDGVLTVLAVGNTTITAKFVGNEAYKPATVSYTLTIQDSREAITLSFAEASVNVNIDESVAAPALSGNAGSGSVTYTSSDDAIAAVDPSTGEVTGVTEGSVTITATVAATNEYLGGTATFTVNVIDPNKKGTATNPYTVAEALEATPASGNSETVYVSGIVSGFYGDDITDDNNHRYYISDDGTKTNELLVYNGKGLNNVAFSSADDLLAGDKVVIVGQLTNYKGTKEFAKDNYVYSRITKLDNTITVAGGTEFTIDRTQDEEELTLTATATSEETVTFSIDTESTTIDAQNYVFEDGTLLVSGNKGGVIVIKANAAGNENYKDAEEVTITVTVIGVKDDATILVEDSEIAYGQTFTVDNSAIEGGAITVTSSNTAVATVEGLVITPAAVGTTTITVATAEDETYKAGSETFTLTVTAPAGLTTAKPGNFVKVTSTEDLTDGQYLIVYEDGGLAFDGSLETLDDAGNSIEVEINDGVITATDETEAAAFTYDAEDGTLMSASGFYIGQTSDANGLASSKTEAYENSVSIVGGDADIVSSSAYLRYNSASNQTRFRYYKSSSYTNQKAIQLYKQSGVGNVTVTFNSYGYATLCSPYPLDFTNAPGVDAYFVSDVAGTQVNFKDWEGTVKGGTPLFLVGEPNSTVTIPSADSEIVPDVNKLVGTLAPTYVETKNGDYTNFGLSGENFVKINSGVVKAGKAYLPVPTEMLQTQGAKLRLVFTDSATGIATVKEVPAAPLDGILYNISGQRVSASYKGIVIKNGKKYLNK